MLMLPTITPPKRLLSGGLAVQAYRGPAFCIGGWQKQGSSAAAGDISPLSAA
jgi:hypothetical protein